MPVGATKLAPTSKERVYIKLTVYNYDASPRYQMVEHNCKSVADAKRTADRLRRLAKNTDGQSFCERNFRIYGFVERVEGIFQEVTTRIE